MADDFSGIVEYDDLRQEGMIVVAENPDWVRDALARGEIEMGGLYHRIWADLMDLARREARRHGRNTSYETARGRCAAAGL